MKLIHSTAFCCMVFVQVFATNLPYNRLKKAYNSNSEKCLEKAELWMKVLPGNPAGYYYASLIHFEQAQQKESARKKYNELSKSLKYARELEKMKVQSFLTKIEWDTLTPHVSSFITLVKDELDQEGLTTLSSSLEKKANRFDWAEDGSDLMAGNYTESNSNLNLESSFTNGQYFGMPNGTEMIPSFNLDSEQEILRIINAERLRQGMEALVWEEKLAQAARYHAYDMGSQNYFDHDSHDRNNGKLKEVVGTFDRIRAFYNDSFVNSENIAAGKSTAQGTYNQWFNSKGHYENMFRSSSKKVGIGVVQVPGSTYEYYWVFCTAY